MPLRKSKKQKATQIFTNRDDFKEIFWENFDKYQFGEQDFKVLVFHGFGGIGKTALLNHLEFLLKEKISNESRNFKVININFSLSEKIDFIDFIYQMKNILKVRYFPFDYAFLKLLDYRGINIEKSKYPDNVILNSVLNFLESKIFVPSEIIKVFIDKCIDFLTKENFQNFVEEIDKMPLEELKKNLPIYLAEGLNKDSNKKYIFFIDSYENILKNKELDKSFEDFVTSLNKGLFVISSREKLKWEEYNSDWSNYIEQYLLGRLDPNDARSFLKKNGIYNKDIINTIIKTSKCIPLYLDLCLDIYFNKNTIEVKDFEKKKNEIVNEFLKHLHPTLSNSIKTLSLFSFFDIEIFKNFIKDISLFSFKEFIQLSGIEYINNKKYKVHTILREFIEKSIDIDIKRKIGEELLYYIEKEKNRYQSNEILELFTDTLNLIKDGEDDILEDEVESIISIGTYLIDRGYWNRIGDITNTYFDKTLTRTKLNNALNFLKALYFRRTNELIKAEKIYINLDIDKFGKIKHMVKFHEINVMRLLGNYNKALEEYEALCESIENSITENDLYIKVHRQYADLLFLKGKFEKSLHILEKLLKKTSNKLETAETLRIIGHIYKFNFMFDKALECYERAYKIAEEQNFIGLKGKLYTNFVEVYSFRNYQEATNFLYKSVQLNTSLNAKLEIGKTYSFYSIANSILKTNFDLAIIYIDKSIKIQQEVGYKAGILFGKYAEFFTYALQKNKTKTLEICKEIEKLTKKLDVYHYLLSSCSIYFGKDYSILKNIEWIDYSKVLNYYKKLYSRLTK